MSTPEIVPANEYAAHWVEIRKRQRHFLGGLLLPFAVMILAFPGVGVAFYFRASTLVIKILFVAVVTLVLGAWIGSYILLFRFMWWRCPRCGHPFFGWLHIQDPHWWRIWSCVHCGLLADAPNAESCRDRRAVG